MIGNLWDVTDGDIDKFLKSLLDTWLSDNSSQLSVVSNSRNVCKMKYMVGAAPGMFVAV